MLSEINSLLRRRRRAVLTILIAVTVALAAMTAHAALMSAGPDHLAGDAATICLAVGGVVAVAGGAMLIAGGRPRRPRGASEIVLVPAPAGPRAPHPLARAGPAPPVLLQVFRL